MLRNLFHGTVKRMMRYLQHTKDLCMTFDPKNSKLDLEKMGLQDEHAFILRHG